MDRMPRARQDDLVAVEVGDELLIYDLRSHKMHRLNEAAITVWRKCDGANSLDAVPMDRRLVEMTLQRLAEARLLEEQVHLEKAISRRDLLRMLGIAAAAAPLVVSMTAPSAAQGASCIPKGGDCSTNPNGCCPGCFCNGANKCAGGC
ncbi:MAG: twin-arginine translocation signal domain-containing protein [Armatimonadetes bacterium]|nr:twin-arginine translocation signal domain-containing protein [Armatimonadota bacterium]